MTQILARCAVELYWLPLGAGEPLGVVRRCGRGYEWLAARHAHRSPFDLYHSALTVDVDGIRTVVEMAPVWALPAGDRGVVGEGPVGLRPLGRLRLFRYEVRRWRGGVIPDAAEAVAGPRRLAVSPGQARRVLELVAEVPLVTWGRDELGTGEMWNSNSLTSWVLARAGLDPAGIPLPPHGRAPGWDAGIAVAARSADPGTAGGSPRPPGRLAGRGGRRDAAVLTRRS
jgi:hypothetical protein